jgi:hypothetical protein
LEVPTIYKAYISRLCKGISLENMPKNMVPLRTSILGSFLFPLTTASFGSGQQRISGMEPERNMETVKAGYPAFTVSMFIFLTPFHSNLTEEPERT